MYEAQFFYTLARKIPKLKYAICNSIKMNKTLRNKVNKTAYCILYLEDKQINILKSITTKVLIEYFAETDKFTLQFTCKFKGSRIVKTILTS